MSKKCRSLTPDINKLKLISTIFKFTNFVINVKDMLQPDQI
jgi:hypothetical protein